MADVSFQWAEICLSCGVTGRSAGTCSAPSPKPEAMLSLPRLKPPSSPPHRVLRLTRTGNSVNYALCKYATSTPSGSASRPIRTTAGLPVEICGELGPLQPCGRHAHSLPEVTASFLIYTWTHNTLLFGWHIYIKFVCRQSMPSRSLRRQIVTKLSF